jgi:hypothetical protein
MSHAVVIPDELYYAIADYAARRGESAEEVILAWARSLREQEEQAPEEDGTVQLRVPHFPTIASLAGIAGSLNRPIPWGEMRQVAREDHVAAKFGPSPDASGATRRAKQASTTSLEGTPDQHP